MMRLNFRFICSFPLYLVLSSFMWEKIPKTINSDNYENKTGDHGVINTFSCLRDPFDVCLFSTKASSPSRMWHQINSRPVLFLPRVLCRCQPFLNLFAYLKCHKFISGYVTLRLLTTAVGNMRETFY